MSHSHDRTSFSFSCVICCMFLCLSVCLSSFYIHCFSNSFMGHVAWNKPDLIWFDLITAENLMELGGLPSTVITPPAVTFTFDHLIAKANRHIRTQIRLWPKFPSLVCEISCSQGFRDSQTHPLTEVPEYRMPQWWPRLYAPSSARGLYQSISTWPI